jgi:hypothetical protein
VLVATVAATTGCEPTPCTRLPRHAVPDGARSFPPPPWPETGTVRPSPLTAPDTDGDGTADTVTIDEAAGSVTIGRTSGELVLAAAGPVVPGLRSFRYSDHLTAGDVDGDGRTDLVVTVDAVDYLVPGATVDGTHAPADVGVRLFDVRGGGVFRLPGFYRVGDLDGDGADDIAVSTSDNYSYVIRGPAVAAPGPGGTLEPPYDDVIAELPGYPVAVLALSPTVEAVAVAADDASSLTLATRGGQVRFDTGDGPQSYIPTMDVVLADGPDGTPWLVADVWARYSGHRYLWDMDEACGPAPVGPS